MRVRVDEPRQQRCGAQLDARGARERHWRRAHAFDAMPPHYDPRIAYASAAAVEHGAGVNHHERVGLRAERVNRLRRECEHA